MSELLPSVSREGLVPLGPGRYVVATRRAERRIERYALNRIEAVEKARIDTRAVAAAVTTSIEEEFRTFDYGMFLAGGSAGKQELLARKLELLSQLDNRLISMRLGR